MARRKVARVRVIIPDPLFRSELVTEFTCILMRDGKKSVARQIVYGALDKVVKECQTNDGFMSEVNSFAKESVKPASRQRFRRHDDKEEEDDGGEAEGSVELRPMTGDIREDQPVRDFALILFDRAIKNIMPTVEVRSRRVGGSTYQVPVEVRPKRRKALGMRWLVKYARERNEKSMIARLANEISDALVGRGSAVRKRQDVHKMAKSNQAFAHYRW